MPVFILNTLYKWAWDENPHSDEMASLLKWGRSNNIRCASWNLMSLSHVLNELFR